MCTFSTTSRRFDKSGPPSTLRLLASCQLCPEPSPGDELIPRLIDFFRFFSHDFQFNNSVLSLRAGQLTKESKGWVNDVSA